MPIALPGMIPDLGYHIGVAENLEIGGRISPISMGMELDAKLRLMHSDDDKFHVAIQPALGLQSLFTMAGVEASMPLIATYEFTDMVALTGYGYAKGGQLIDITGVSEGFSMSSLGGGLGAGLQIKGDSFYFMPYVDGSSTMSFFNNEFSSNIRTDAIIAGVSIGYHGDIVREIRDIVTGVDKKVDRVDEKVDKLDERTNRIESKMDEGFEGLNRRLDEMDGTEESQDATSAPADNSDNSDNSTK